MIRIVTDSTCEGPPELLQHPLVHVVPLSVVFGQQALRDGVEITREEFWRRLPTANPLPTTSQATPGDFIEPFERYTQAGDEVIALVISSKLSGTHDSALQAKATLADRPIDVIDSYSVSVGLGLMLEEAVRLVESGATRGEIVRRLEQMRGDIRIILALDTLEYLQRGGRIGKAQALMGTLLKFKPLLAIQEGEVAPLGRVRTKSKAIDSMLEALGQQVSARGESVRLAVTHAETPQEAAQVAERLQQLFSTPHVFLGSLGPVVGTHVGPGTVGAAVCALTDSHK